MIKRTATLFGALSPDRCGGNEFGMYGAAFIFDKGNTRGQPAAIIYEKGTHRLG